MRLKALTSLAIAIALAAVAPSPFAASSLSLFVGAAEAQPNDKDRGNSANAPGRSEKDRGNSASAPGQSDKDRGNSANAPGQSDKDRGNSANAPGQSDKDRRQSANAPGQVGKDRGNSANAPGQAGKDRGNSTNPPGHIDKATPPEPPQAATAPRIRPRFLPSHAKQDDDRALRDEISVVGLDRTRRNALRSEGFRTISTRKSETLGGREITRIALPPGMSPGEAAARVRNDYSDVIADKSHLYLPAARPASVHYAQDLVGLRPSTCPINTRIGLIDTGVGRHPAMQRVPLTQRSFAAAGSKGNYLHGTAVASLLIGQLSGVEPLAPGARIYSANVFAGQDGLLASNVNAIIEALDWMISKKVPVVNLSLVGPPNALLQEAIHNAARQGLILVAAGGNDGPGSPPVYPAAYDDVIAVAAVDQRARPYTNSNRGSYVEIAAPGVDIWAANMAGGEAFWTGTSFAVPFVSAALAQAVSRGVVSDLDGARAHLRANARDLGAAGRDPIYGYGLLQVKGCG